MMGSQGTEMTHWRKVYLILLSVDDGITGYRDDSLETVKRNQQQYDLPLKIVSYEELYGWTMDAIVKQIGLKNNCTFCGVFRRQALDRGAMILKVDKIVTGHNADDIAETVIMNVLRGDIARLRRCTAITTGMDGALPRCKPFKYTYEKEIVMYAYFKKLDYFSTECIYSPNAYRGFARAFIKDLEKIRPSAIIDIIHSGESLSVKKEVRMPVQGLCSRCGCMSSNPVCKACVLLEGLNRGLPRQVCVLAVATCPATQCVKPACFWRDSTEDCHDSVLARSTKKGGSWQTSWLEKNLRVLQVLLQCLVRWTTSQHRSHVEVPAVGSLWTAPPQT
ncbi:cytoplasmic tRNA 2-thiolation protein 1-like isoform X3 [Haliotis rubra]|uniref:cytoplasmic tRNA 2-thiolation protein 1-like isoform X3 n=1 Tax=Haliotis rubra TaxID=36100 RepID=UPI001EE4F41C|nr:cytoplasmic tRNA 2-thiolation protein 1-like isoform X3 [Haliotis rubra]